MRLCFLPLLALMARAAAGASAFELEAEIGRVAAERQRLSEEASRLRMEAAVLADGVAAVKTDGATRADGALTRRLRELDRAASRLDRLERETAEIARRLARLRSEFETAADAEERRLQERARREGVAVVAPALDALARARRTVAAAAAPPIFRPPLDIVLDALDGPAELDAKRTLIEGESARVAARLAELRGDEALVAVRLQAKREWARQIAAARRDAAGDVELLDRGHDDAEQALRELTARAADLARERATLEEAAKRLQARRNEAEARLGELRKGR